MSVDSMLEIETLSKPQLTVIVQADIQLTQAIVLANPIYSQETSYEPFDSDWFKKYFKKLLSEITGKSLDLALEWALVATAIEVSEKIISTYGLDASSQPAALAMALLLIKAAKDSD